MFNWIHHKETCLEFGCAMICSDKLNLHLINYELVFKQETENIHLTLLWHWWKAKLFIHILGGDVLHNLT